MNALLPGQFVGGGRFLLERILGQGGMGVVWLAHDQLLREPVALKFLPPQLSCDPAAMDSLRTETLRSRKLSHPNILRIHDLVDAPGETVFIAMEYVDGSNLHALRATRPGKVLSWEFLAPLVTQLCGALDYAHGEKVIHRDLKPANLMLDSQGRLKLADFGLARVISDSVSRLTGAGNSSGTLAYMSPQQADGRTPRVTDDLYSVGATLYELLTGTPPFYSGDVAHQMRHLPPQPMSERLAENGLTNDIPDEVAALVVSCLAKNPDERPQTARAVLDRLGLSSVPLPLPAATARPLPECRRLGRWAIAAAFVALAVGVTLWATLRPPESNLRAEGLVSEVPGEPGFMALFNGKDLTGWDGDPKFWSVQDGAIGAITSEEGVTRRENTCLIWNGTVTNFVLRLSFRLRDIITEKPANSGVLYRSRRIQNWQVRGYQCELHGKHTGALILLEDTMADPRSQWGQTVSIKQTGDRVILQTKGAVTPSDRFGETVKIGDWNDLEISAHTNRIVHRINGVVTLEAIDQTASGAEASGLLALELKRATNLQFKNIRLKRL